MNNLLQNANIPGPYVMVGHSLRSRICIYSWNFNVNVKTIQHEARDSLLIFGNDSGRASTGFLGIITLVEIHRYDQLENCKEIRASLTEAIVFL